jgi:hypothetical protein
VTDQMERAVGAREPWQDSNDKKEIRGWPELTGETIWTRQNFHERTAGTENLRQDSRDRSLWESGPGKKTTWTGQPGQDQDDQNMARTEQVEQDNQKRNLW